MKKKGDGRAKRGGCAGEEEKKEKRKEKKRKNGIRQRTRGET
jgi:hypothetical protein